MGVSQINSSFQNDGNFSQLDLKDKQANGPLMRIETFRCSQPQGTFGITKSGTKVRDLAGIDHLKVSSNRTFRHVFSSSSGKKKKPTVSLEMREIYSENGSIEVRTRDVDGDSETFGWVLLTTARPSSQGVEVRYEVRRPKDVSPVHISSPLSQQISKLAPSLSDLGNNLNSLGTPYTGSDITSLRETLIPRGKNAKAFSNLDRFGSTLRSIAPKWTKNVQLFERMGDFRDKCIHPGTNLTGPHLSLASEYVLIRAYRKALIMLGRVFDGAMSTNVKSLNLQDALSVDPKPGVYSVFLSAYALNIVHYQLGIDKVHSDYGGVPMALKPGSRLETGIEPVVDATNANRMLAVLAGLFYAPSSLPNIISIRPGIKDFKTPSKMRFLT